MTKIDDRLRTFVERIERISAEIAGLQEDRRDVYAEAKAVGYDAAVLRMVVAFNTANLDPVVAAWTKRFPLVDWIIAADDDHLTGVKMFNRNEGYQNPGIDKAEAAAGAHGCRVAYPARREGLNTDFSDLLLAGRMVEVAEAINGARRKIDPAGASLSLAERIGAMSQQRGAA